MFSSTYTYLVWPQFTVSDINSLAVLSVMAILIILEILFGYCQKPKMLIRQSYLINLGTFILNDILMSLMSVSALLTLAGSFSRWGLLGFMENSIEKSLLSFLLLDLTLYLWHRANHKVDFLWIFHKVHHSDPCINVTTAFRLHFMEVLMTTMVTGVFIVSVGVDAATVLANELLITLFVMFHHANVSFIGEAKLGRLLIVPSLHRLHHSVLRNEHDQNYGAVLSCWDKLFCTLSITQPKAIGLLDVRALGVFELVKFGFTLRYPAVTRLPKPNAHPESLENMIAEAAYYRAGKRGFAAGNDISDWLEAEKEILAYFS